MLIGLSPNRVYAKPRENKRFRKNAFKGCRSDSGISFLLANRDALRKNRITLNIVKWVACMLYTPNLILADYKSNILGIPIHTMRNDHCLQLYQNNIPFRPNKLQELRRRILLLAHKFSHQIIEFDPL